MARSLVEQDHITAVIPNGAAINLAKVAISLVAYRRRGRGRGPQQHHRHAVASHRARVTILIGVAALLGVFAYRGRGLYPGGGTALVTGGPAAVSASGAHIQASHPVGYVALVIDPGVRARAGV